MNAYVPCLIGGGAEQNGQGLVNPLKDCDFQTLLKVMPLLQTLVRRITDCDPKSSVLKDNAVSRFALSLVVKDSFVVYRVMNEAIIRLVEKYFDTTKVEATKGLEIFKKYLSQIEDLQRFYDACDGCGAFENGAAGIKLEAPPATFMQSMVEYCESAPREGMPLRERRMTSSARAAGPPHPRKARADVCRVSSAAHGGHSAVQPGLSHSCGASSAAGADECVRCAQSTQFGFESAPAGERRRLRGGGAAPPTEPLALPPAVPTMTASSTNTLDPFAALPPAPAPAPAALLTRTTSSSLPSRRRRRSTNNHSTSNSSHRRVKTRIRSELTHSAFHRSKTCLLRPSTSCTPRRRRPLRVVKA